MTEKLTDYQVIDVHCGGTFYKVKHKVTNEIFAWKAYNCCAYTGEQIQNIVNEVKTISQASSENLLRYYDTILHAPTKTLYFVLEYHSWRSVQELLEECKATDKYFSEGFVWRLLHALARVCKAVANYCVVVLRKCITPASIFVSEKGELRVNCFDLVSDSEATDLLFQVGQVVRKLCFRPGVADDKIREFHYSDDLMDVVNFISNDRSSSLRPDVVLYHPTVLTNLETHATPQRLSEILVSGPPITDITSHLNKCDSEKVGELSKCVEPLPRTIFNVGDSPIYCNITVRRDSTSQMIDTNTSFTSKEPLSPTLAALALELPGYVPRCRKPYSEAMAPYSRPQQVSNQTLSTEWMSRLVALRQREESLNKRERDLLAKEIVSSPAAKLVSLNESQDMMPESSVNGITLPAVLSQVSEERREWARRRQRRSGSVRSRGRRKTFGYEDLDSSLSADAGDNSIVITATKFTAENMPRRNIFPEASTKKVHFTPVNPFVESDESVTLTFYELDNLDKDGYQVPKGVPHADISKFKYFDSDKLSNEKRSAMSWNHSSPSKQARVSKSVFNDISNTSSIRKTPSKTSLTSKGSNSSRFSLMSGKSQWSMDTCNSKVSDGGVFERTRSSIRQSLLQTPIAPDMKKKTRRSLIPFKTPFKFISKS